MNDQPSMSASSGIQEKSMSPLSHIERDIRALMTQLSEARFALRQCELQEVESTRRLFSDLVEVLDAFDRVFRNIHSKEDQVTPQMKTWIGNFRTVRRLLDKPLSEHGVVKIENLGEGFDSRWHCVSEVTIDPSKPEGTITEEVKPGYVWRGQVLRKAEVIVVGPPMETREESSARGE